MAAGLVAGPTAAQTQYDYLQIDYPEQTQTQVFGNNDNGDVVGIILDAVGNLHGFIATEQ